MRPRVQAADEQILVRETIRGVATRTGSSRRWRPSRGPAAPATAATSTSRCGTTASATASTTPARPTGSPRRRGFLAGVLEHLPGLCGLTAPSFDSYQRIVPQYWAGAFPCWGWDNREAPLRLPSQFGDGGGVDQRRATRPRDATCNPYLALGGLIAAGLDGIERGLEPPEPVEVDPATLAEAERAGSASPAAGDQARGARRAGRRRGAHRRARAGAADSDLAVRRSEWAAYSAEDEGFGQRGHFEKY